MSDPTVKWQMWEDIHLAVAEIVEMDGLRDVVYHDGMFKLRIDVTGGKPGNVMVHFLALPWFIITSRFETLGVFTHGPARGIGFHNYIPYSWTLRKVNHDRLAAGSN